MGKELEIEKDEVKLNPVTDGDIARLNFVVNCIRQIESALDVKKNEIEIMKKYTRQDLATIDLAFTHMKETVILLKDQRDEMEERLKSDSFDLYEEPLDIRKGNEYSRLLRCLYIEGKQFASVLLMQSVAQ